MKIPQLGRQQQIIILLLMVQKSGYAVELGSLTRYLQGFIYTSQVVVWDF